MTPVLTDRPKLRLIDFQPIFHQGERMWLLRDPWQLSDKQLIVPQALAQLLVLCDGTRTADEIRIDLSDQLGTGVPMEIIIDALVQLDEVCLLENRRFEDERDRTLRAYRASPHRLPALAGLGYPAEPHELTTYLRGFGSNDRGRQTPDRYDGRGIVSPHIDFQRGGQVYAQVWNQATPSLLEADLVLIFGTDHNGRPGSITLTRQPYATPFGILPADSLLIDQLAEVLGEEAAFAEELNHRYEHSIELSAVWLHHIFVQHGKVPCPMVPILVGSFHHFLNNGNHPANDETYNQFLGTLRRMTAGRRVIAIGSVDLAHVGPSFGDSFEMENMRRSILRTEDRALIAAITQGDAAEFYRQIWAVGDKNRICGFAPLYLMLRFLEATDGLEIAYEQCPADQANTSLVSICGLLLR